MEKRALRNYELYFELPKGKATLEDVKKTPAGIEGFAQWMTGARAKPDHAKEEESGIARKLQQGKQKEGEKHGDRPRGQQGRRSSF